MAISWLPSLKRFVMFYGGDVSPELRRAVFHTDVGKEQHDPQGSLYVRYAEQPWGPWAAPEVLLATGDLSADACSA